ncbi:MAG: MBL fold metallo-hydrolase [Chloroflexota bacterium]|nr:MBL fold metallo-hydrolase [Chloroflexota bacterium]
MSAVALREADRVEITVLVDNYTDLFVRQNTEVAQRPAVAATDAPLAEHGLSFLVKVYAGSEEHAVLMDAGISTACLVHNATVFGVDFGQVEAAVLSHGHLDHFGGLAGFLERARKGIPLVLHPDAFLERRLNVRGVMLFELPRLDESALEQAGVDVRRVSEPSTLASDLMLVLGEVERVTDFETGFAWAEARINDEWVTDPFRDDQGVAVKVKGKGLVVMSGCAHAGIINTVKHAQKVALTEKVHAVLGGFHLTGPLFEPLIEPTIAEMKKIAPDFVVPMHCTGWNAVNQFAREMPEQFVLNVVGTTYVFQ